jgi:hypothetical protein
LALISIYSSKADLLFLVLLSLLLLAAHRRDVVVGKQAPPISPSDPMDNVRERFPGGRIVYRSYEVDSGLYALSFTSADGRVSTLTIRTSCERFPDTDSHKKPDTSRLVITAKSLVGQWFDPKNGQSLELFANGTYRTGVGGSGRFTVEGDRQMFTAAVGAWDRGRVTMTKSDVLEFYWTHS